MYYGLQDTNKFRDFERENLHQSVSIGRPPLRNTGNVKKVESAVRNDRRHMVGYLAEITG